MDDVIGLPDPCPQHGANVEACLAAVKRSIEANRDLPGVDYASVA